MSEIFRENTKMFDNAQDADYLFREDHLLRQEISLDLLGEVIDGESKNSSRLLSIACSTGVIEEQMKDRLGLNVFGVDAAINSLNTAKERGIHCVFTDVSKSLPFGDNFF